MGTLRLIGNSYAYDPSGNRLTETRDGVSIIYAYNNANQITSRTAPGEAISYSYDNNGSLITETSTLSGAKSYSYDFEDRLTHVIAGASEAIYTYSGDGRRTSSNVGGDVVKYIYDGMTPLIEKDASDTTQAVYTKNPFSIGGIGGLISSYDDTKIHKEKEKKKKKQKYHHYYHDSNLGNVNQITDSSGAVIQTYDYDSFGNITNQTGSFTQAYLMKG